MNLQSITPCLWFDQNAQQAVDFYVSVFPHARILRTTHYTEVGHAQHGMPAGLVLTIDFELDGQRFMALNGGPVFQFTEAVSLVIECETQEEVDRYWTALSDGGDPAAQQCGWLKDQFGLSWQVVPRKLGDMFADPDQAKSDRVMAAMLQMKKLDLPTLEAAYEGR